MPEEQPKSLKPEDVEVENVSTKSPEFTIMDMDPTDQSVTWTDVEDDDLPL